MKLLLSRTNIIFNSIALLAIIVYLNYLKFEMDPRLDDLKLSITEMYPLELIHFIYILISTFAIIFASICFAWKAKRHKRMFLSFFVWPSSFYFIWKYRNEYNLDH